MNKRNKHILVNLTETQYIYIKQLANDEHRKLSDLAYILIIDATNKKLKDKNIKLLEYNEG